MSFIYQWIDVVWVLLVFVTLAPKNWLVGIGYILSCIFILRLQVELMELIGFSRGAFLVLDTHVLERGQLVYGVVFVAYFLWAYHLRRMSPVIFMAHSIAFFFIGLVSSTVVMVL